MKVLITGANGQDGRLMIEELAGSDHKVYATSKSPTPPHWLSSAASWRGLDVTDQSLVSQAMESIRPDLVFHFAGISSVAKSWEVPQEAIYVNSIGTTNLLEAIRRYAPLARLAIAGSSEVFGRDMSKVDEDSPIAPSSPYGVSKAMNLELARLYREVYGVGVLSLIMFNHESPYRPMEFVSQSIANQAARVKLGYQNKVQLRDLRASKDWGWAPDFVRAIKSLALTEETGDFVIATGKRTSVLELAESALLGLGLAPSLVQEVESEAKRPNDAEHPVGDASKLANAIGWKPSTTPQEFMGEMSRIALERMRL